MNEIVFFTNPLSRGRIAHWMLEEIGVPYETRVLRLDKGEHKASKFRDVNPMGKVPTLVHDGQVVTEAAAICAYLADAFPEKGLAPKPGDPARGTYYRWLFFGAGCVEPAMIDHMLSREPPEGRPGLLGYGTYKQTLDALEKAITPGPYILGDTFSAADVYIGSQLGWGMMTKSIEPRPAFLEYLGRVGQRPAALRVNELNDELAAKLKADG
ncbi:MAG TPA: glutathione S-transferase family protein [Polyangiaceae bacterium]|jgi:glutathione S-transferase|nr:glutathione S-transferase family protein [Polyangiaceae bacterium]